MKSILVSGNLVKAEDQSHPLQMKLKLVLTPFTANANGIGIPLSEADNFIRTAKNQPFKINFNGMAGGHDFAYPVGLVNNAELAIVENESVILGDVVVWKDEYPDVANYLEQTVAEKAAHTSWEIYYDSAEIDSNVQWLHGVVFAGTCVVNNPAYQGKTPILAVAEMNEKIAQLEQLVKDLETERDSLRAELDTSKVQAEDLTVKLTEAVASIDTLTQEVTEMKRLESERQQAEAEAEKNRRKEQLIQLGVENVDEYLELDSSAYTLVISAVKKARAEINEETHITVPNIGNTQTVSSKELAKILRGKR